MNWGNKKNQITIKVGIQEHGSSDGRNDGFKLERNTRMKEETRFCIIFWGYKLNSCRSFVASKPRDNSLHMKPGLRKL